jgi:hypothetical protein
MPGQLAKRVRAKYPGQYDDLDDDTLEKKILAKYPNYADLKEEKEETSAHPYRDIAWNAGKRVLENTKSLLTSSELGAMGRAAQDLGKPEDVRKKEIDEQTAAFNNQSPIRRLANTWDQIMPTGSATVGLADLGHQTYQDVRAGDYGGAIGNVATLALPVAAGLGYSKYVNRAGIPPSSLPQKPPVNVVPPVTPIGPKVAKVAKVKRSKPVESTLAGTQPSVTPPANKTTITIPASNVTADLITKMTDMGLTLGGPDGQGGITFVPLAKAAEKKVKSANPAKKNAIPPIEQLPQVDNPFNQGLIPPTARIEPAVTLPKVEPVAPLTPPATPTKEAPFVAGRTGVQGGKQTITGIQRERKISFTEAAKIYDALPEELKGGTPELNAAAKRIAAKATAEAAVPPVVQPPIAQAPPPVIPPVEQPPIQARRPLPPVQPIPEPVVRQPALPPVAPIPETPVVPPRGLDAPVMVQPRSRSLPRRNKPVPVPANKITPDVPVIPERVAKRPEPLPVVEPVREPFVPQEGPAIGEVSPLPIKAAPKVETPRVPKPVDPNKPPPMGVSGTRQRLEYIAWEHGQAIKKRLAKLDTIADKASPEALKVAEEIEFFRDKQKQAAQDAATMAISEPVKETRVKGKKAREASVKAIEELDDIPEVDTSVTKGRVRELPDVDTSVVPDAAPIPRKGLSLTEAQSEPRFKGKPVKDEAFEGRTEQALLEETKALDEGYKAVHPKSRYLEDMLEDGDKVVDKLSDGTLILEHETRGPRSEPVNPKAPKKSLLKRLASEDSGEFDPVTAWKNLTEGPVGEYARTFLGSARAKVKRSISGRGLPLTAKDIPAHQVGDYDKILPFKVREVIENLEDTVDEFTKRGASDRIPGQKEELQRTLDDVKGYIEELKSQPTKETYFDIVKKFLNDESGEVRPVELWENLKKVLKREPTAKELDQVKSGQFKPEEVALKSRAIEGLNSLEKADDIKDVRFILSDGSPRKNLGTDWHEGTVSALGLGDDVDEVLRQTGAIRFNRDGAEIHGPITMAQARMLKDAIIEGRRDIYVDVLDNGKGIYDRQGSNISNRKFSTGAHANSIHKWVNSLFESKGKEPGLVKKFIKDESGEVDPEALIAGVKKVTKSAADKLKDSLSGGEKPTPAQKLTVSREADLLDEGIIKTPKKEAPKPNVGTGIFSNIIKQNTPPPTKPKPKRKKIKAAKIVGEVGQGLFGKAKYGKFMKNNPKLKDIMDTLIKNRGVDKLVGKRIRDEFKHLKEFSKSPEDVVDFQERVGNGEFPEVRQFFDDQHDLLTEAGVMLDKKENYLPQLWDNSPEEVRAAYGDKQLNSTASFQNQSIFKDYAEGIEAKLTPKMSPIEMVEWYARRANNLLADRQALSALRKGGYIFKNRAPKGVPLEYLDRNLGAFKDMRANPSVKKVIENYLQGAENSDGLLQHIGKGVGKAANLTLSSGLIPNMPITTFHGASMGAPLVSRSFLEGGIKRNAKAMYYGVLPSKAAKRLTRDAAKMEAASREFGVKFNVEDNPGTQGSHFFEEPDKGNIASRAVKKTTNAGVWLQNKLFEDALFNKMLPALKWDAWDANFKKLQKKGHSRAEAGKAATDIADTFYSGKNLDLMYNNKTYNQLTRIAALAPDWLRSTVSMGIKVPKSLIPGLKNFKSPESKAYRRAAARVMAIYSAASLYQKATTGKHLYENPAADQFNVDMGEDASGEKKRSYKVGGSALDFFRIPLSIATAVMKGEIDATPEIIEQAVENRASGLIQAILAGAKGEDYKGETNIFKRKDNFGNPIPLGKNIENSFSQILNFGPPQVSAPYNFISGRMTGEEALARVGELPLKYKKKKRGQFGFTVPSPEKAGFSVPKTR